MTKKQNEKYEICEDATRYGEFITSYFAWLPLSVQKEKVEDLENITNNGKNKRRNIKSWKNKRKRMSKRREMIRNIVKK